MRTCTIPPPRTGARNSRERNSASALARRSRASLIRLGFAICPTKETEARCKFQELGLYALALGSELLLYPMGKRSKFLAEKSGAKKQKLIRMTPLGLSWFFA